MSRSKKGARVAKARIADFNAAISDLESRAEASRRARAASAPIGGNGLRLSIFDETSNRKVRTAKGSVKGFRATETVLADDVIRPENRREFIAPDPEARTFEATFVADRPRDWPTPARPKPEEDPKFEGTPVSRIVG